MKAFTTFLRTWLTIACLAGVFLSILSFAPLSAAPSGSVVSSVTPSNATPTVGSTITATIIIDMTAVNAPDNYLGSFSGTLNWSTSVLTYSAHSGLLPEDFAGYINTTNTGSGTITFNGANPQGATGNITIITIDFIVAGVGTSALDLNYTAMAAASTFGNLRPILTTNDGSVTASLPKYTLTAGNDGHGSVTLDPSGGNYDSGTTVTLTPVPASGYTFDSWGGTDAGDIIETAGVYTIIMNANKTVIANFNAIGGIVTDLNASVVSDAILLDWTALAGASGYNVYRSTTYDFTPAAGNRIAENINDEDAGHSGVQFTDNNLGGANVVGDVNLNYFYKVTGLLPAEGAASNVAGEFDYPLVTTSGTDINEVVVLFNTANGRTTITNAEQLAEAIPNCTNVYQWSASGQGIVGHPKDTEINNFTIVPGYPYMVNVTVDGIWSVAGRYDAYQFGLITTAGTDINHISVPLSQSGLSPADALAEAITSCTNVYYWDTPGQGTVGHPKGIPINDFPIKVGYPYYVNVTEASTWPAVLGKSVWIADAEKVESVTSANVPHTAYGRIEQLDGIAQPGSLQIRAWIVGREQEVLNEGSVGSYVDGEYWAVSVANFPTAWRAGERLHVELRDGKTGRVGDADLTLTTEGSDEASIALATNEIRGENLPTEIALFNNYPNPFNPTTEIRYGLPEAAEVTIRIYNISGRLIKELESGYREPGTHQVTWDGRDSAGRKVSSGVYLCHFLANSVTRVQKILLAK